MCKSLFCIDIVRLSLLWNSINVWWNYCLFIVQYLITHFNDFQLACLGSFFLHESVFFLSGLPFIYLERAGWLSKYKIQVFLSCYWISSISIVMWLGTQAKENNGFSFCKWFYYLFSMLYDLIIGSDWFGLVWLYDLIIGPTKAWTIVFMFKFQSSVSFLHCCMIICSTVYCFKWFYL